MDVRIGTAPDSWGVWFPSDPRQIPWNRFLDEVAETGYEWIELGPYGYLPTDLHSLKSELDRRGLKVSSTFLKHHLEDPTEWQAIEQEVQTVGSLSAALSAKFLVLIDDTYTHHLTGEPARSSQLDASAWKRLIDTTSRVADLAQDRFGLRLAYHPHVDTHIQYEDQIEAFLEQTDPDRVSLCLDTGHHAYAGGDPVKFMRKHHRRIPYLHLKSVDGEMRQKVERNTVPFAKAVAMGVFCEPSQGVVDFAALRDVLRDVNFEGWAIVEQDMYPAPFDKPLPIAKRTRAFLHSIGIE